ncbi:diaminopimelate epimerase [Sediminibacterium ginsengisoli]|uniref:Diaminopimelate epimerase n=1 Tax=Sediminibacterium ginsengisoli TaxID=413434 RepID=A0A1T4LE37_9BACT|nr:diaminopimelate epimerase [Sediminibacterium ginsengisoli]SJZ53005.1 diaminopimelate epimerase [Sediminibacterium ginsengisoli]
MTYTFYKYQGTGNDFIIMDNRDGNISLTEEQVKHLCDRRFGIGADGLMLLNTLPGYDFEMIYYNSDGRPSSMCGNGGRCLTRFAYEMGIHCSRYRFMAVDGEHEAELADHGWIRLKMKDVDDIEDRRGDAVLNTGSPHYIKPVTDVMALDVYKEGRAIRYNREFESAGINVNFVENDNNRIIVRTYERGVEDETYSCGTGVTASALVFAHNDNGFNRVEVKTKGGHLAVEFDKTGESSFRNIWLCGPATFVFKGEINS